VQREIHWTLVIVVGIISSLDGRTGELMDTFIDILLIIVLLPLALYVLFLLGITAFYAVLSIINCLPKKEDD